MLFLIKRGPRPDYHNAPFHPVIICTLKGVADWEVGGSDARAWLWSRSISPGPGEGWLLERWNGFNVDYGGVVRAIEMPDGTKAAFVHHHTGREPWSLLSKAVWWSEHEIPDWLAELGVKPPDDDFSRGWIQDRIYRVRQARYERRGWG